jgi:serine-type D-Ala-D-Ala carboxypeptidase (penicillin-binding protein 5/6)
MRNSFRPLLLFFTVLALAVPAGAAPQTKKKTPAKKPAATTTQASPPASSFTGDPPKVRAASVLVIDAKTGRVLHEKNPDQLRPPASTQKLLTALLVAEAGDLDREIRIVASDTWAEPVKLNIQPGQTYTRRELLEILLVHSMNDVARALARDNAGSVEAFAAKMNQRAMELGMFNSHFINPNGLPAPGQLSTARDLSRIAQAAYANRTIREIVAMKTLTFRYSNGKVREFKNTNRVLRNYAFCNGMKTGYTEAAGRCLIASGAANGREVIVVVLGNTSEWIWKDSYALLAWGLNSKKI